MGVKRGHSVAQRGEGASPEGAVGKVDGAGVVEGGVVGQPVAQDGLPSAKPVKVERHNNAATGEVGVQVIPQSGLVSPGYVAPRYDDLVWLQLGHGGCTNIAVEEVDSGDTRLGQQRCREGRWRAAIGVDDEHVEPSRCAGRRSRW